MAQTAGTGPLRLRRGISVIQVYPSTYGPITTTMTVTGPVGNCNAGGVSYGYQWRIGEGQKELISAAMIASRAGGSPC